MPSGEMDNVERPREVEDVDDVIEAMGRVTRSEFRHGNWMGTSAAGRALRVNEGTIRKWIRDGLIPARTGWIGQYVIRREVIVSLLDVPRAEFLQGPKAPPTPIAPFRMPRVFDPVDTDEL